MLCNCIDFEELVRCDWRSISSSAATNVRTGQVRVFRNEELTPEVVLASSCLPNLFQAVEIGREHYWDGGYMGNPSLFPLFYYTRPATSLSCTSTPSRGMTSPGRPWKSKPPQRDHLQRLPAEGASRHRLRGQAARGKDGSATSTAKSSSTCSSHSIRADEALKGPWVATKFVSSWEFLTDLRDRAARRRNGGCREFRLPRKRSSVRMCGWSTSSGGDDRPWLGRPDR